MRVVVGRLTGVFGIRGELKCKPTALGQTGFAPGSRFTYRSANGEGTVNCTSARRHHERLLLAFEGIGTPDEAAPLVGAELFADRGEVPLGPDEYLDADLIGLRVVDEMGRLLARVVAVEHYPAQDCLVVEPGRALIPLVKAFIRRVDIEGGAIVTTLPAGLLD